jgi:hypothetical protein
MFHFTRHGLLFVAITMEIISFSIARVQNNVGSFKPVVAPTSSPSLFPSLTFMSVTAVPSFQSQVPQSISPSNSSFDMTLSPSFLNSTDNFTSSPSTFALPSLSPSVSNTTNIPTTNVPSLLDTFSPSIDVSQVNVTIIFHGVEEHLSEQKLTMLARETLKYLYMSDIHVDRVSVLSQSTVNSRRLLARSLAVVFEIEGHFSSDTFLTRLHFLLLDNFSEYLNFLVDSLPMLKPLGTEMTSRPTRSPTIVKEQNEFIAKSIESHVLWWLVGAAVALSIIAILALLLVRRSRQSHQRKSRLFPVEQTAVAVSVCMLLKEFSDFF